MYTVWKLNLDGSLSHRENLDDGAELDDWMIATVESGRHASVVVRHDNSGRTRIYTDNGGWWDRVGTLIITEGIVTRLDLVQQWRAS